MLLQDPRAGRQPQPDLLPGRHAPLRLPAGPLRLRLRQRHARRFCAGHRARSRSDRQERTHGELHDDDSHLYNMDSSTESILVKPNVPTGGAGPGADADDRRRPAAVQRLGGEPAGAARPPAHHLPHRLQPRHVRLGHLRAQELRAPGRFHDMNDDINVLCNL